MDLNLRDYNIARAAKRAHRDHLLAIRGVTGLFTGEKIVGGKPTGQAAVVVTVAQKKPWNVLTAEELIPPTVDGVPTDVIEATMRPLLDDYAVYDPLIGGVNTGVAFDEETVSNGGTLGMIVTDIATGQPMALSNHHVIYANGNAPTGSQIVQPNAIDVTAYWLRNKIGVSTRFCFDNMDAAVSTAYQRAVSNAVKDIGPITAIAAPTVGMAIQKCGFGSNLQSGTITAIDYDTLVGYTEPTGAILMTDQIRFEGDPGMTVGGDSGSVLITGGNTVVGLVFAGNESGTEGVATDINLVFAALDIELYNYTGPPPPHMFTDYPDPLIGATSWVMTARIRMKDETVAVGLGITNMAYDSPQNLNFSGICLTGLVGASTTTGSGKGGCCVMSEDGSTCEQQYPESRFDAAGEPLCDSTDEYPCKWRPDVDIDVTIEWNAGTVIVTAIQGGDTWTSTATGGYTAMPADSYLVFGSFASNALVPPQVTLRNLTFTIGGA